MAHHRNKTFKKLSPEDLSQERFIFIRGYIDNIFRAKRFAASIEAYGFFWLCEFTSESYYKPTLHAVRQFKLEDTMKPNNKYHSGIAALFVFSYIYTEKAVKYMTEFMRVATSCVDSETKVCVCSKSFLQMRSILQERYCPYIELGDTYSEHVDKLARMRSQAAEDGNIKYYILPDWEFTYNVRQEKGRKRVSALRYIIKYCTKNVYVVPHLVRHKGAHTKLLINP